MHVATLRAEEISAEIMAAAVGIYGFAASPSLPTCDRILRVPLPCLEADGANACRLIPILERLNRLVEQNLAQHHGAGVGYNPGSLDATDSMLKIHLTYLRIVHR